MNIGQNRLSSGPTVALAATKPEGLVSHYPVSSVLVVFSIGLGVGVALGSMFAGSVAPSPSFRQRTGQAAEKIGRQVLDVIAGVLPDSLSKHIS